jgi:hypothetical protein
MDLVDPAADDQFLAAHHGVGRIQLLTTGGAFAAWFDRRRKEDAWVELRVGAPSTARFVDPLAGRELARARLLPGTPVRLRLPPATPLLLIVVEDEQLLRPRPPAGVHPAPAGRYEGPRSRAECVSSRASCRRGRGAA